jgi:hypothetical protein
LIHKYLWGEANVMKLFATCTTKSFAETESRVDTWVKRWESDNPFAALSIRSQGTNDFVGYIVMGFG